MARRLCLFVYGTLQPQADTGMARWLRERTLVAERASAPGRLFAIRDENGWFPALVRPKSGARVWGTLCEVALTAGDRVRLDRYEGREYRRVSLPVRTASGARTRAQLYLWRAALPAGSEMIEGRDFLVWLRRTRRRAFSTPSSPPEPLAFPCASH